MKLLSRPVASLAFAAALVTLGGCAMQASSPTPVTLPATASATSPATLPVAAPGPIARDPLPSALNNPSRRPCTPEWFSYLEKHYTAVGDAQGHGPDLGSDEWLDAFERRRNLPSTSALPREQRCATLARELDYRY